jgi:predicted  nucleic acid-binding Zn-ribbon protein
MKRKCDNCGKEYEADKRNINRGWGLCCSKSCAASKREKSKPGYDIEKVRINNIRREFWNFKFNESNEFDENYDEGDSEYWDNSDNGHKF